MISNIINDLATASSGADLGSTAFDGGTDFVGEILTLVSGFVSNVFGS